MTPERFTYDRAGLRAGIVHVGVGGFHRAHQAMVVDRLLELGLARDRAILGVGLLPADARMRDVLRQRDLFGSLVDDPRFTGPYLRALSTLRANGAAAALESL
ncbi:hypothetical protein [Dactylosporangium salmoneum]|uniref:Mannitol dehydrogenase family protein n=1 Tax=Dactylosporangium salmoneum TaxID=53361 RepID=A0ABN3FR44_9ACTN